MAGYRLTDLNLYDAAGTTPVLTYDDLRGKVDVIEFSAELGREPRRTIRLGDAGMIDTADAFDALGLVRFDFEHSGAVPLDDVVEWWRVIRRNIDHAGSGKPGIELRPMWMDLARVLMTVLSAGGASVTPEVLWIDLPLDEALAYVFGANSGIDQDLYTLGTVDAAFEDRTVTITEVGLSVLEILYRLSLQVEAHYRFDWDPVEDEYVFSMVPLVGDATPGLRRVDITNATSLTSDADASGFFSRIVPVGGVTGASFVSGDAIWAALSPTSYDGVEDETTLTISGEPIRFDDQFVGGYIERLANGAQSAIVDTVAPNQIVVSGFFSSRDPFRIFYPGGERVDHFDDPDAVAGYGVVPRIELYPDAIPYENWANIYASADMRIFDGGAPEGFQTVGEPTIVQTSDPTYLKYSSKAALITASAGGQGIMLNGIGLSTERGQYFSGFISLHVVSGAVRIRFGEGVVEEPTLRAEHIVRTTGVMIEVTSGGMQFAEFGGGAALSGAYLEIVSTDGAAEFAVEYVNLTTSVSPYPPGPLMGASELWRPAQALLTAEGGAQFDSASYDTSFYDLSTLGIEREDEASEEVSLGDQITLIHEALPSRTVRVMEIRYNDAPGEFRTDKTVRLGQKRPDFGTFDSWLSLPPSSIGPGTISDAGLLVIEPDYLDYGGLISGQTLTQTVTLTNNSQRRVTILDMEFLGVHAPYLTVEEVRYLGSAIALPFDLPAGETAEADLNFTVP